MKPIRMQVTALGGRIIAGHPNKSRTNITEGSRCDVTSDFMFCLVQKAEHHGGTFTITGGGDSWTVTVEKDLTTEGKGDE